MNIKVLRACFVKNLNQLLDVLGQNRKDAAETIGVPYKWLRRMVSAGTGRKDERNTTNLEKVAQTFCLPCVDDLWQEKLICWLVSNPSGKDFSKKFEANLIAYYSHMSNMWSSIDQETMRAIGVALMRIDPTNLSADEKLLRLLATGRHDYLIALIDRAYEETKL